YSEGLIVTSACLAGEVAQHLMEDRWAEAREAVEWHANLFDGRYYLEVQGHDSQGQDELNRRIFRLAEEVGVPVVATNDAHFLRADDHAAHDVLLCIGLGKDLNDPDRMHYDGGLYFKSAEEMAARFPDRPDVLENTLRIADEIELKFEKKYHVPEFRLPPEVRSEADLLRSWVWEGARSRYADDSGAITAAVRDRIEYELEVITKLGYSGYFLITADFIRWARERDIQVGPGRGS